jgi:uncharacterized membrane protein YphA (DoxX/SURF4 family)
MIRFDGSLCGQPRCQQREERRRRVHRARGGVIMEKSLGASEITRDRLEPWTPKALSVLRMVTGLLFLEHGTQKLLGFPPSEHAFPPLFSLMGLQGSLELVGGFLILIGLILAGDMAVAYFMAHAPKGLWWPASDPLLLRVPLSSICWRRRVERRCADRSQTEHRLGHWTSPLTRAHGPAMKTAPSVAF